MPLQSGEWDVFRILTIVMLIAILAFGLLAIFLSNQYFSGILKRHITKIEAHEAETRDKFVAITADISLIRADIAQLRELIVRADSGAVFGDA